MAAFDVDVPEVNPHYVDSQPIKPFQLMSSTAENIKGISGALTGAIKGSDEIITAYAKDVARQGAEAEQGMFSEALGAARAGINLARLDASTTGNPAAPADKPNNNPGPGVSSTEDLMSTPSGDQLPGELKTLPGKLNNLWGGKASGALTETDYYGRLTAMAKDLRSRFPIGYHDYIDQEISKITGVHPANAYIKSVLSEINSFMVNKNDETKAVQAQFRELSMKGIDTTAIRDHFAATGDVRFAEAAIADRMHTYGIAQDLKARKEAERDYKDVKTDMAQKEFLFHGAIARTNWFEDLNTEFKAKGVQYDNDGNPMLDPNQREMAVGAILKKKNEFVQSLRIMASRPDNANDSFTTLAGPQAVEDHIKALAAPFDDAMNAYTAEKGGRIGREARVVKEVLSNGEFQMLLNPNTQSIAINGNAVRKLFGEKEGDAFLTTQNVPLLWKTPNFLQKKSFAEAPPEQPYALKKANEDAYKLGVKAPAYYNDLIDTLVGQKGLLSNAPDRAKLPLAASIAHPSNVGWLNNIKEDYTDSNGLHHTGRIDAWNKVTDLRVGKEIVRLGMGKDYVDTMSSEFRTGIFQPDMRRLAQIPGESLSGLKFHWDSDHPENGWTVTSNKIDIAGTTGGRMLRHMGVRRDLDPAATELAKTVSHVNEGIAGLVNVAKAAGQDPNRAVLQLFADSGFNLEGKNVEGMPAYMIEAMKATKERKAQEGAAFEALGKPSLGTPVVPSQFQPMPFDTVHFPGPARPLPPVRPEIQNMQYPNQGLVNQAQ